MSSQEDSSQQCPYAVVGAGKLFAMVWTDDGNADIGYRFNICSVDQSSGKVTQLLGPEHLPELVRLCHALACTFVDDNCVSSEVRRGLITILKQLGATSDDDG